MFRISRHLKFAGAGIITALIITRLHCHIPLPNCFYTKGGEYANCNHQEKHFKEVTHEKDIQCDQV
jgi:hypothetical protein